MEVVENKKELLDDFIRLNEEWISTYFELEDVGGGFGHQLMQTCLTKLVAIGAQKVYLVSNTKLEAAIALYKKHGFNTVSQGQHPVYSRANIVMERHVL